MLSGRLCNCRSTCDPPLHPALIPQHHLPPPLHPALFPCATLPPSPPYPLFLRHPPSPLRPALCPSSTFPPSAPPPLAQVLCPIAPAPSRCTLSCSPLPAHPPRHCACARCICALPLHPTPAPCRVPHCPRILSLPCTLFLPPPSAPSLCPLPLPPPSPPRPVSNSPPHPVRVVCVHEQGGHQKLQQRTQLLKTVLQGSAYKERGGGRGRGEGAEGKEGGERRGEVRGGGASCSSNNAPSSSRLFCRGVPTR